MNKKKKFYKILRTAIYILFIIVLLMPVLIMINTSLKTYSDITVWPPTWFGKNLQWINYKNVLTGDKSIVTPLINSFIVSSASSIICLVLGILAAYAISRYEFKGRNTFLIIIIITQMFASVILVNPMYIMFRNLNLLDTRISLIIANAATSLPMTVWLLYSYISNIPKTLEEAAWMDGFSRLQGIRYILVPILAPGVITAGLFSFIMSWGDLIFARSFIVSPEMKTISMALTDFQSLYKTTWETQMAAGVISVIPIFIIFVFIQKHLVEGLTSSGIKG
ncbi:carbohydrate ABC transporter permease [Peptostreptococcus russellii]|uniref:Carbohydrate ABC transporter membrane protein 2, CUT1 family n=1 Tax=Peptostreptococcus russellii TaxID=215200 RepID=A0A1H8JW06_9FIRM|nr:carbohydrate ABC transporter permease [Peptostreptococcus russellii]MBC2578304.1 carbohydrate ABC transporter permease [Peptostreptococcus russellii]SEN84695.1 carbohydrate ABC transporter membrane protein 2, CUT1 family [Peptostreptococcus russellii]